MEQLNKDTVSKFSQLQSFKEALNQKRQLETFYKSGAMTSHMKPRQSVSQGNNSNAHNTSTLPAASIRVSARQVNLSTILNDRKIAGGAAFTTSSI